MVELRPVGLEHLDDAYAIELAGYPADEAATREKLQLRLRDAPDLFLGAWEGSSNKLLGYVCGTRSSKEHLAEESMSSHEPDGKTVCIHSVCVDTAHRRKGIALQLLKQYLANMAQLQPPATRVALISHDDMLDLYLKAGFRCVGQSVVHHGSRPWIECVFDLP